MEQDIHGIMMIKHYADNWEKIFGKPKPELKSRKETPSHASTQIHKDKTKVIPRKSKYYDKLGDT